MQSRLQDFFAQVRGIHVAHIARQLGLTLSRHENAAGPCPVCGFTVRSQNRKDHRLPLGFRTDGQGWECQHCHEKGDGIELVALTLGNARFRQLPSQNQADVFDWYIEHGFVSCNRPQRNALSPVSPTPLSSLLQMRQKTPSKSLLEEPLRYPPPDELLTLWNLCLPLDQDPQVCAMLQRRGMDPCLLGFLDLARALPPHAPGYSWMQARGNHWRKGWRLLLPAFDHHGQFKSLKARWIHETPAPAQAKSVSPCGCQAKGLLLADSLAHHLLQHSNIPDTWPTQKHFKVWIVEGDMDFLGLNASPSQHKPGCPAIFGIWAGSWNEAFAARLPLDERLHITIATDPDESGKTYATNILKTLIKRGFSPSQLHRWTP